MKNRPERLIFFLVVWLTMFSCLSGWGQKPYPGGSEKDFLRLTLPGTKVQEMTHNPGHTGGLDPAYGVILKYSLQEKSYESYPAKMNVYTPPSAIFCKIEWEMEKATHIPLRFRLGSLADCNTMEGKR